MIAEGTRVKWVTASGVNGSGQAVTDEIPQGPSKGHLLVAVDAPAGEEHRVIYCAATWLTEEKPPSSQL